MKRRVHRKAVCQSCKRLMAAYYICLSCQRCGKRICSTCWHNTCQLCGHNTSEAAAARLAEELRSVPIEDRDSFWLYEAEQARKLGHDVGPDGPERNE